MCKDSAMESHRFTCLECPLSYRHERGLRSQYLIAHQMGYSRRSGPFVYSSIDEAAARDGTHGDPSPAQLQRRLDFVRWQESFANWPLSDAYLHHRLPPQ